MQIRDFYGLPRAVQERFLSCVRPGGYPRALLEATPPSREAFAFMGAGAGALVGLLVLIRLGVGDAGSALAVHGPGAMIVYVVLAGVMAAAVLRPLALRWQERALPFRPAIYVFAGCLVDATHHELRVFSARDLVQADAGAGRLRLVFQGDAVFEVPTQDHGKAKDVAAAMNEARARLESAPADADPKTFSDIDPLVDIGFSNPLAVIAGAPPSPPLWVSRVLWVAAATGVVLGPAVGVARNRASDEAMFAAAIAKGDPSALRAYLARGSAHKAEVSDVLLPKAELREAASQGTVEAVEAYAKAHAGSRIQPEIDQAMTTALRAELEVARKAGTVGALARFAARHPRHGLDAELAQATHAVYKTALAQFKAQANEQDPALVPFVERLLAYAEKSGPRVEVRFRRRVAKSLPKIDLQVKLSHYYMGTRSLPSRYFDPAHLGPREDEAAKVLAARLGAAFPAEMLAFEPGAPVADAEGPLPPVTVPTLFVEYTPELTGNHVSTQPRLIFVGTATVVDVSARIPGDPKPFSWRSTVAAKPDLALAKSESPVEEKVYAALANDVFAELARRYVAAILKAPPQP